MNEHDIAEQAYKNGYEAGKADAVKHGMKDDLCFAVKDANGFYYCGYNHWDIQFRKAKLYHSYKYAVEARDDSRWAAFETFIVRIRIIEEDEYNPDWEL